MLGDINEEENDKGNKGNEEGNGQGNDDGTTEQEEKGSLSGKNQESLREVREGEALARGLERDSL